MVFIDDKDKAKVRLIIETTPDFLHEFKLKCMQNKKTMRDVIIEFIYNYLKR